VTARLAVGGSRTQPPQDSEYELSAALVRDLNEGMRIYTDEQVLEVSIDRERVATCTLGAATLLPSGPNAAAVELCHNAPFR
jgi:hypothetical protein